MYEFLDDPMSHIAVALSHSKVMHSLPIIRTDDLCCSSKSAVSPPEYQRRGISGQFLAALLARSRAKLQGLLGQRPTQQFRCSRFCTPSLAVRRFPSHPLSSR